MHILEIPSFLPPYGGYFCIEQTKALVACGHKVGILHCQQLGATVYPWHFLTARYNRWEEKLHPFNDNRTITLYRTNMRGVPKNILYNQNRYCKIIAEMFEEYVSRYGAPDIIHAHGAQWAGTAAMGISEKRNIPYFITEHLSSGIFHDNYGNPWSHDLWAKDLIRTALEKAKCVITVSDESVLDLATLFGNRFKTVTISNIIDLDFFKFKEREKRNNRPFRFCCLANANGKFYELKGYDTLLKAFSKCKNAELHIAGRETTGKRLKTAVRSISNSQNIFLYGELSKEAVRALLWDCDALVLATCSEMQPLVVMEAMSTGIPVVSTTAIPMALRIPGAFFTSPVNNPDAIHEAMIAVQAVNPSEVISNAIRNMASPEIVGRKLERLFMEKSL